MIKQNKFTYNIVPIDVDGDGIPDGDLIEQINKNGVVVSRKFVTNAKMTKLAKKVSDIQAQNKNEKKEKVVMSEKQLYKEDAQKKKIKIISKIKTRKTTNAANARSVQAQPMPEQPVVRVADATSFGQSLKTGAATGIGFTAGKLLVEEVFNFF